MSGAAGGSRINKEDLKATIRDYRDNILKPLGLDKSYNITGVRSRPEKDIFGDIDIVVSFPGGEKKELKQDLAKFLSQVDAIPTMLHKKNNKYFIHGNIVSTLYPIFGKENEYVQIDNIVTTSKEEGNFTFNMLDLPAQEQTLTLGLAKTIFTELDEKELEKGIKKQQVIDAVAALEEKYSPLVMSLIKPFIEGETMILKEEQSETIALMPGAFKPPHRDHLRRINAAAENSDKSIILISPLDRVKEGETPISAKQSLAIWQLYKDKGVLAPNIEFLVSPDNAPVKTAYDISTANPQNQYIGVYGKEDAGRWKNLPNEKYPNLRASDSGITANLSASGLRAALKNNEDITPWMPDGITPEEYKQALGLNQVQELFEPSSNIYDYNQNGLDYYFTTQDGDNYVVGITPESDTRIAIDFGISDEEGDIDFQETNKGEVYKIIATVAAIVKNYLNQHPEIEIISWSSVAKKGEKKIGDTQRDKLYKLVVKKQGDLKDEDIVLKDSEYWAYLKGYNPMFEDISNSELFDIEDYADEKLDPIDIKIPDHFVDRVNDKRNHPEIKADELYDFFDKLSDDKEDLIALLNKGEEVVATDSQSKINIPLTKDKYSKLKNKIKTVAKTIMRKNNFLTTSPKLVFEQIHGDSIVCDNYDHDSAPKKTNNLFEPLKGEYLPHPEIKQQGLENNLEFKELLVSLTMHMMDQINIEPLPDLIFIEDDIKNAEDILGKTAYYNPDDKSITLYTCGRHPKDILRSYAHEMIHHKQNLEGKLTNINTQNINEDEYLKELEVEAYTYGNGLLFRGWENSIK